MSKQTIIQQRGFLRPKEAAIFLGVGLSTFWRYVKQEKIKTSKLTSGVTIIAIDELNRFANQSF
ncbi:MAG: hypothetical protein PHV08_06970 [Sulfurovaceae bacterium]|nr:hypothetical protein [Sulfurovaceae bacterium]